ncbi:MAG: 2-hydroxymuconic semialdehyde dehydrogenase [Pseudomonadota bacterium]|uniref:2-hydroxymuconic semialdehyde dehydrogenase n=1 Tax=Alteromonas alba TaxID=2079529 RepID=A0A2S9VFS8_9ALTE|nr:2-hydroxymuconic semialdehyde dehydrogenase [Alteromonas alba]MAD10486.1 2-hydroxymuconic semialdehyde dehydrogenase [Alteromonas sp.]MDY6926744.1 2-hydroxymuconic semialdehyde dehydrogenase [Pseudomonadota bacterium]MCP4863712.1 2-hydroxymuconic semialdehyde dehydrogenase [Alteromonas sp.]PRO75284.1 2-hydroxymuconic semialdehyde dehydrogenase [Alteromonas alba]HCB16923.1 2-hydroxymuconic semialdehyde dehydrogenase [Alteromonas sp.]
MKEVKHYINGQYVGSASGRMFDNINPATGEVISQVHEAGEAEVDAAVKAARAALKGPWSKMTIDQRSKILHAVADGINARFDEFLEAECADTGKPKSLASHIDIPRGAANFKVFADMVKNVATEAFEMATPDGTGALNYAVRRPKGVIGVISPWNLPLLLMTWKVGPALACGNTVVVKPSEETPTTTALLGEVMKDAGVPDGVFNVVQGYGGDSAGAFLTAHPDVDGYTFTGETRTGELIMQNAAKGVRDISLELGGKNAGIVFADCDMDKAIEGTMRSAFANCGQVCLGTERVYVERSIFDEFVSRLKVEAEKLVIGPPDDAAANLGPLISQKQRDKVLSYYQQAVNDGATVVTGGGIPDMPDALKNGSWIQPTIWTGLSDDSAVINEEIFGPCCHIQPFDSEEEAIAQANRLPYGLASAIWTENLSRAARVAGQVEAGIVWVNSWFLRDLRTAFGGSKQSGIGREGGEHSLEFYTELKNICLKL